VNSTVPLSSAYKAALVLIRLGMVVVTADGPVTPNQRYLLEQYVENARQFTQTERARLAARLHWSLTQPLDLTALKQRCNELDEEERGRIGQFLVGLAGVDGRFGPDELKTLEKVYKFLSLKQEHVSRDVHTMATALSNPAREPVTIIPADEGAPAFALPSERPEKQVVRVNLSSDRVAAIIAETHLVTEVLGNVFVQDEADVVSPDAEKGAEPTAECAIPGLDESHSVLARLLAERSSWLRSEVEGLSSRLGLMAAGAIEAINEAAYEFADEPFLEGDDPLEVNTEIISEFIYA
jgi:uncharacterized tellurite resistance protein B-like protein